MNTKAKKRTAATIALAVLFVILLAVYFIFVRPSGVSSDNGSVKLDLLDGEVMITDRLTTFYIFEPIKRDDIRSIKVENEYGGYTLARPRSAGAEQSGFLLDGNASVPFNDETLSSLIVTTGTPVAVMRVAQDLGDDADALAEYGLDKPQASWTLTRKDGKQFTVYVGDELLTEGGYYVKYADRDAVYIVSSTLRDTILADRCALISPKLITGLTENNVYYMDSFAVSHGNELFLLVERVPEYLTADGESLELKMLYPRPENNTSQTLYSLNDNVYFDVLYSFIDLAGDRVVSFLPTDEELEGYGLADPEYAFILTYGKSDLVVFVSARQENGKFYATSELYGFAIVCEVSGSTFSWLEYDAFKWIEEMPFYVDIRTVSRISVKGYGGSTVDLDFILTHSSDSEGHALLEVLEKNSGKVFTNNDVANFRRYYATLMNITNQAYASLSEEDKAALVSDEDKLIMTMTYENLSGEVFEYRFYKYYESSTDHLSGGKAFVTVNGIGEFYTKNDLVEKVLSDAVRVMNGLDINSYGQH